jgi:small subunit ribosomal protein S4
MVYESAGATRALERRDYPPGMVTRRGKLSNYGLQLAEKQKVKHYYGLSERQLRRYFDIASRRPGNTGEQLLLLCERRLDNVIRRAGFTHTRPQARQGVVHCHFLVNGAKVNKPSFLVRPGDVVAVRKRTNLQTHYRELLESSEMDPASWLALSPEQLECTVLGYPGPEDISLPVEVAQVVELLAR